MWRGPEFQRFQEKSELVASFLFREAQHLKNPGLNIAAMDPDRASTDFCPIEHKVIRFCPHSLRMCLEQFQIFVRWRRKWMVSRNPSVLTRIEFEQRKIDDPKHVPPALWNPVLLPGKFQTQRTEQVQSGFRRSGHQENRIAFHCPRLLNDGIDSRCARILYHRSAVMPSSPILIHATPAPPSCFTYTAKSSSCLREYNVLGATRPRTVW